MSNEKLPAFEEDLAKLEEIVKQLEDGGLPLEKSISLFEEGQKLLGRCRERLNKIQVKVERLLKSGAVEPMEPDDE